MESPGACDCKPVAPASSVATAAQSDPTRPPEASGARAGSGRTGPTARGPASAVHRRFGILCVLGYVALSWAVRVDMRRGEQIASLLYPLDTFSMYAPIPGEHMSHLLVRDRQGAVHRVTAFRSFDCAEPVTGKAARCTGEHGIEYHYDDLTNYIQSHAGPGESPVELIARTWEVRPGAPPAQTADCVIAHCKVSR